MTANLFTIIFVFALLLSLGVRYWLAWRQMRWVTKKAAHVPAQFADAIDAATHAKAAAYTIAKQRVGLIDTAIGAAVLVMLTLLGGIQLLADGLIHIFEPGLLQQTALVIVVLAILGLVDLPLAWYRQFRIEQAFGFNRSTLQLFFMDLLRSVALGAVLGLPLLFAILWLMTAAGPMWWLWAWALWVAFQLLITTLYPVLIAPIFNRFTPLPEGALRDRVQALLTRTGFSSRGVYTIDGSRRSSHGNAYFAGFGRARRIVFFDTLVERLRPEELEAVLAHELGHFKLRHIRTRVLMGALMAFALFALLGWIMQQPWFYQGLGVSPDLSGNANGVAVLLFILTLPVFSFPLSPLTSVLSRRHEFEADAFAARQSSADHLISALVKLYKDNASTLTPDPIHSAFYDSHPPAILRVAHLQALLTARLSTGSSAMSA